MDCPAAGTARHRLAHTQIRPFTAGSGIPQVIASLSLPYGAQKPRLIRLGQTLLKIPLTFLGMLFGASIGREGPSVQVGAAVMGAWGAWCKNTVWRLRVCRKTI